MESIPRNREQGKRKCEGGRELVSFTNNVPRPTDPQRKNDFRCWTEMIMSTCSFFSHSIVEEGLNDSNVTVSQLLLSSSHKNLILSLMQIFSRAPTVMNFLREEVWVFPCFDFFSSKGLRLRCRLWNCQRRWSQCATCAGRAWEGWLHYHRNNLLSEWSRKSRETLLHIHGSTR